jgi:hypothetical protein
MPCGTELRKEALVGADLRAARRERHCRRTSELLTEITAASEMRPYQPTAKAVALNSTTSGINQFARKDSRHRI